MVPGELPMPVEVLGEPGGGGGGVGILAPAADLAVIEVGSHGDVESGLLEEVLGPFAAGVAGIPEPVEVGEAFLEAVTDVAGPVAELGIEIVMIVPFPGRELSIVGGPRALERDGRVAASAGGTELIGIEEPLAFDGGVGEGEGGFGPVVVPPVPVAGDECVGRGGEDGLERLASLMEKGDGLVG